MAIVIANIDLDAPVYLITQMIFNILHFGAASYAYILLEKGGVGQCQSKE